MARSGTADIYDRYRWTVSIEGFTRAGFSSCSTPEYSVTTRKYAEGGSHLTPRQIVESIEYKPIILARGLTNDTSFNKWATGMFDLVTNEEAFKTPPSAIFTLESVQNNFASAVPTYKKTPTDISQGKYSYRRDVKIEQVDRVGVVQMIYFIYGAFPIGYKPGSDFDASADGEVSIETLTLTYESFEVKYPGITGALASALIG
jgi:phage tail-like protein